MFIAALNRSASNSFLRPADIFIGILFVFYLYFKHIENPEGLSKGKYLN